MKSKQLRKAKRFVNACKLAGVFGPDPDQIFYLMFTREIETARRIIHRHGFWLIHHQSDLFNQIAEIAAIVGPVFNRPDCNGEYWD